jgi:hypothetical protein
MGLNNCKSNWICSDCGARVNTCIETFNDVNLPQLTELGNLDYEVTEFERCDEFNLNSPTAYVNTGLSNKFTVNSPQTPLYTSQSLGTKKVISRNARKNSVNIVESIRKSSFLM